MVIAPFTDFVCRMLNASKAENGAVRSGNEPKNEPK